MPKTAYTDLQGVTLSHHPERRVLSRCVLLLDRPSCPRAWFCSFHRIAMLYARPVWLVQGQLPGCHAVLSFIVPWWGGGLFGNTEPWALQAFGGIGEPGHHICYRNAAGSAIGSEGTRYQVFWGLHRPPAVGEVPHPLVGELKGKEMGRGGEAFTGVVVQMRRSVGRVRRRNKRLDSVPQPLS